MNEFKHLLALCAVLGSYAASATTIDYTATNVAGTTWRYDWTVTNDTLTAPIDEFTLYFDRTLYAGLTGAAGPAGWDPLIGVIDPALPDDGFVDFLALSGGIAVGAAQGGYSVLFTWLGADAPGAQGFDIVDPANFEIPVESGRTRLAVAPPPPAAVPEPGSLALLSLGLLATALAGRSVRPARSRRACAAGAGVASVAP